MNMTTIGDLYKIRKNGSNKLEIIKLNPKEKLKTKRVGWLNTFVLQNGKKKRYI
jgi:hypothetical protein